MPNSYEHSYQHDLDDVIDASDAVLAIGTEKVDTTTLKDRSLNNNNATIHGAMPSNGYFLGRKFHDGNNYLDCGTDSSLNITGKLFISAIIKADEWNTSGYNDIIGKTDGTHDWILTQDWSNLKLKIYQSSVIRAVVDYPISNLQIKKAYVIFAQYDALGDGIPRLYIDGVNVASGTPNALYSSDINRSVKIGYSHFGKFNGLIQHTQLDNYKPSETEIKSIFNTIARLPLYSHNFERYPNSDTSLASVFPYTSGIITSGSFNKTDGLKCTSAGQIIFSNSFEFDGSEYITLIIDGVEYSGTTTVTQGTITATIAQGSNDITIDMGTGDVLPDIRVQFREEV